MAITRVQNWTVVPKTGGAGSTVDNVLATVPVAGNLLQLYIGSGDSGGAISGLTITDTIGDGVSWTAMTTNPTPLGNVGSLAYVQGYYKVVGTPSGGAKTVTATISGTQALALFVAEYGDGAGSPTWAVDGAQIEAYGPAASGAPIAGSIVVTGTNTIITGFAQLESGTLAAGTNYTSQATNNVFAKYMVEDRITTSAATYPVDLSTPTDRAWGMQAIAFTATTGTPPPTVTTVSSNNATEGSAIVHTVTLSGTTSGSTNYAATLAGVTATGGGTDFTSALGSATYSNGVTFSAGNMVVPNGVSGWTVSIPTAADTLDEVNETYTLTVGGVAGTGTITDDDAAPSISASDAIQSGGTVTFNLNLSAASGQSITVRADTANGAKTAGTHFTGITNQTVTFAPGETSKTVVVTVL